MPLQDPQLIVLSVPISGGGSTAAATFSFWTSGYKPPRQPRATSFDDVNNQNGRFRYIFDNGPGALVWEPFEIAFIDAGKDFAGGAATQQAANLDFLWNYRAAMGMQTPDGIYSVAWADAPLERRFGQFPSAAGDKIHDEMRVVVNFIDGG